MRSEGRLKSSKLIFIGRESILLEFSNLNCRAGKVGEPSVFDFRLSQTLKMTAPAPNYWMSSAAPLCMECCSGTQVPGQIKNLARAWPDNLLCHLEKDSHFSHVVLLWTYYSMCYAPCSIMALLPLWCVLLWCMFGRILAQSYWSFMPVEHAFHWCKLQLLQTCLGAWDANMASALSYSFTL